MEQAQLARVLKAFIEGLGDKTQLDKVVLSSRHQAKVYVEVYAWDGDWNETVVTFPGKSYLEVVGKISRHYFPQPDTDPETEQAGLT